MDIGSERAAEKPTPPSTNTSCVGASFTSPAGSAVGRQRRNRSLAVRELIHPVYVTNGNSGVLLHQVMETSDTVHYRALLAEEEALRRRRSPRA